MKQSNSAERDAIAELEKWNSGHKARYVQIDIDDGYGATCWRVRLNGENNGEVHASEVQFFNGDPPANVVLARRELADGTVIRPDGSLFTDDGDDWPGLAATILAAIDHWNAGHTRVIQ